MLFSYVIKPRKFQKKKKSRKRGGLKKSNDWCNCVSIDKVQLRASTAGRSNGKCKVHLAFRPKMYSATGRPNGKNCKKFYNVAKVPS